MVCFIGECETGAGKHFWDVDFSLFPAFLRWQYIHGILLVVGISLVKISIGFFLLRLIKHKWYRRIVVVMQGKLNLLYAIRSLQRAQKPANSHSL